MSTFSGAELDVRVSPTGEVLPVWDDGALRSLGSWEDLAALADANGIKVIGVDQVLGDGFNVIDTKDKRTLLGVPFVIISWSQHEGDVIKDGRAQLFTSMRIMTKDGRKIILNDGSTGIHDQVTNLIRAGINPAKTFVKVARGLRVSEYEYTDPKTGDVSKAQTYYLDTATD